MKILRFDSVGGASGDMILNALLELCELNGIPQEAVENPLHQLIPEHFHLRRFEKGSHGMFGKTLIVDIHEHERHHEHAHGHGHHEHHHRSWADIRKMIVESDLPKAARDLSLEVFQALAEAEGRVHGKPIDEVHFHEVGAIDSIIDIVGCCLAYTLLAVDGISVSPLPVGEGLVHCAHGVYPLPAPATQALLEKYRLPISRNNERCEMLTPTGATLLAVWKKAEIPGSAVMCKTFNSFGHREMESRPNVLRATIYQDAQTMKETTDLPYEVEELLQLETNLDDSTGEILGATMATLFTHGALDVWFTPLTMKKQRPATLLGVLIRPEKRDEILKAIFTETTAFGIREFSVRRYSLARRWETVQTAYGPIRVKIGTLGATDIQFSPEFSDCQSAAATHSVPVASVLRATWAEIERKR